MRIMAPPRRKIDQFSTDFNDRFALGFRRIVDRSKLSSKEIAERLCDLGLKVTDRAVDHWLRGESVPHPDDAQKIAELFGIADYRHLYPPPLR